LTLVMPTPPPIDAAEHVASAASSAMPSAFRRPGPRLAALISGAATVVLVVIALLIVLIAVPKILHALEGGNPWRALAAAAFLPGGQATAAGAIGVVLRRTRMTPAELADRGVALLVLARAPYVLGILGLGVLIGSGAVGIDVNSGFIWSVTIVAGIVVAAAIMVAIFARPVDRVTADVQGFLPTLLHLSRAGAGGVRSAIGLVRSAAAVWGTVI
jgi:hypothetical protein